MLVYSHSITPRLQYSVQCCAELISTDPWELTTDADLFKKSSGPKINYSSRVFDAGELTILPQGLLFQEDILPQTIHCSQINGVPVFFQNDSALGFDLFAAVFYLLSRYEEYLPHTKDIHGRYHHSNALAFKQGFIKQPLVNYWADILKTRLTAEFREMTILPQKFCFLPTYDVDMAWSYLHKGWQRNLGGLVRDLIKGQFTGITDRLGVLTGRRQDPYDSFGRLDALHEKYRLAPKYFFLVAASTGSKDKNISPAHPAMQALIKRLCEKYDWGLHPSWQSGDDDAVWLEEKQRLEALTGKPVRSSRPHYLRDSLPHYRKLIAAGIQQDYSMGYAGVNGFRASIASPFYWYDLLAETTTSLRLFPFCFMDATALYYEKLTPQQAYQQASALFETVREVGGLYSIISHNDILGTAPQTAGWFEAYAQLIALIKADTA